MPRLGLLCALKCARVQQRTSNQICPHVANSLEGKEYKREDTNGERTENVIETECPGAELPEQCTRTDEEAGSIVLHVDHDTNEKEKNDEEADEAAAKETEEISKEDAEIRRFIEEGRNTPKEEKQRLKEVDKRKKCISDKK